MPNEYKNNHYVPIWYQKRFVPDPNTQHKLFYLDLVPRNFLDSKRQIHIADPLRERGYKHCFSEEDLYTTSINGIDYREIERMFFGSIDTAGREAVEWCSRFSHPWDGSNHIENLLMYMTTQKLRTPKGLGWLKNELIKAKRTTDKNSILQLMTTLRRVYGAIWMESIWQIADASKSDTKFIISDHPVTVYNRRCGPRSEWCRGVNDPDVRFHASHTIFPLSHDKILIFTNLSWVRNPYQKEVGLRPNPNFFRDSIMNITEIQTLRYLSEEEVRQINFILKNRAYRNIAAAKEEWLYPEKYVSKSDWANFGHGYLFMPDPRTCNFGGQMIIGFKDGSSDAFDEYGRKPWQKDYRGSAKSAPEQDWFTHLKFQGEFARLQGPYRRGRAFSITKLDNEKDSDDFHNYHLNLEKKKKTK